MFENLDLDKSYETYEWKTVLKSAGTKRRTRVFRSGTGKYLQELLKFVVLLILESWSSCDMRKGMEGCLN